MLTFDEFMSKLAKIDFTIYVDKTIESRDGFKLSYRLQPTLMASISVQVVLYLRYKDQHIAQWGCIDETENRDSLTFFEKAKSKVYKAERAKERQLEDEGKSIFDNL